MSGRSKPHAHSRETAGDFAARHMRFGWWSLLFFLSMGIVLEALHALKVGIYVDVANEARRLMWTLAHAHGTLLALIHIAFAVTIRDAPVTSARRWRLASPCLLSGSFLLPGGFLLGGVFIYDGDPGLGVFLVPVGALVLLIGVLQTARLCGSTPSGSSSDASRPHSSGSKKGDGRNGSDSPGRRGRSRKQQAEVASGQQSSS